MNEDMNSKGCIHKLKDGNKWNLTSFNSWNHIRIFIITHFFNLISIYFFKFCKWISFSSVVSLSVSIYYKVKNPYVLHLGNFIALTCYFVSPYFCWFSSICLLFSSLVGLSLVLIMKLFFLNTPVFFMFSWYIDYKLKWRPINSANDCCPSSLCVCM